MEEVIDNNALSPELARLVAFGGELNKEFREVFMQEPTLELAVKLVKEEAQEYLEAAAQVVQEPTQENIDHMLKEAADLFYVFGGCVVRAEELADEDQLDNYEYPVELEAAVAFIQTSLKLFANPSVYAFCIHAVHQSNMSKLGEDGKPIIRDDGKILKGPNYQEPDLSAAAHHVLERYIQVFHMPQELQEAA